MGSGTLKSVRPILKGSTVNRERRTAMKTIEKTYGIFKRQVMIKQFSGISELQRWIKQTPVDSGWEDHSSMPLNFRFCGAHDYEEASSALLKGSSVAELKRAVSKGKVGYGKPKIQTGVIGACPNVPAVVAGSPACMYRRERALSPGAFNIYVDNGVHAGITKDEIYQAGVDILIKVLQLASKYPINLYVGNLSQYDGKVFGSATQIINAGKPFNVARVSYALTEPGFLRVFSFCVIERNGKFWPSSAHYGYGRPLTSEERSNACKAVFKNTIVLSAKEVIMEGDRAFSEIDKLLK